MFGLPEGWLAVDLRLQFWTHWRASAGVKGWIVFCSLVKIFPSTLAKSSISALINGSQRGSTARESVS